MIELRDATIADQDSISHLHALSWQRHYRGMLSDHFLDHEVVENRRIEWEKRFSNPDFRMKVILAMEGNQLIGFACSLPDHDPVHGSLLDNLHVDQSHQGRGLGKRLLEATAAWVVETRPGQPFYLWVFEKNTPAIRFYDRMGGICVERVSGLFDMASKEVFLRYRWNKPHQLLTANAT